MEKKNDICERLQKFAVDVILYLRTVKKLTNLYLDPPQRIGFWNLIFGL